MSAGDRGRSWAWGIIAGYVVFVALTLTMVGIAFSMRVDMVSDDYYQREMNHQQHIDRVTRTAALPEGVEWTVSHQNGVFVFHLPADHFGHDLAGQIHFYRPDNVDLDRAYDISLDRTGEQHIAADELAPGHWRIRIEWTAQGLDYYSERTLSFGA